MKKAILSICLLIVLLVTFTITHADNADLNYNDMTQEELIARLMELEAANKELKEQEKNLNNQITALQWRLNQLDQDDVETSGKLTLPTRKPEPTRRPSAVTTPKPTAKPTETPVTYTTLSIGSKGDEVKKLQNRLNELGYDVGKADGEFGSITQTSVSAFQLINGIVPFTGTADDKTQKCLFSANAIPYSSDAAKNALSNTSNFVSELTPFESLMMESVSSQINSAIDFTESADKRSILAALLTMEYKYQQQDFEFDLSLPMYVTKKGKMAAVCFAGQTNYIMVIYQSSPLSTSYGEIYCLNPSMVETVLKQISDSVWTVALSDYNRNLAILVDQIGSQVN